MQFKLTSTPKIGSILSLKFIDVLDIVSIPEADEDNNIDLNAITLVAGKQWHTMQAVPGTGSLEMENIETKQGSYERPNIKLKLNDATMEELNKLYSNTLGRFVVIPKDGNGNEYLCGDTQQWLKLKYKLDTENSRNKTQFIDVEFTFS